MSRYYRFVGFDTKAHADLVLTELQLWAGGSRADLSATITSSTAPSSGDLSDLSDGLLVDEVVWLRSQYSKSSFYIQVDLGSDEAIDEFKFGAGSDELEFVRNVTILESQDGVEWDQYNVAQGIVFPGYNTMQSIDGFPTTWNPVDKGTSVVLSTDRLTATAPQVNGIVRSTDGKSSGKWYFEIVNPINNSPVVGVATPLATLSDFPGVDVYGWVYWGFSVKKIHNGVQENYGVSWALNSDVIGVAVNIDDGEIEFFRNNVSMGVAYTGITGRLHAAMSGYSSVVSTGRARFAAADQTYSPPVGYSPWSEKVPSDITWREAPDLNSRCETAFSVYSEDEPYVITSRVEKEYRVRNLEHDGDGFIEGTTKVDGTPDFAVSRRVRLFREQDGLLIRETFSDVWGDYRFEYIKRGIRYTVVTYDHTDNFRAVIADKIIPEIMP